MLNWFKKTSPAQLATKSKFSNYVLGVDSHQDILKKLCKKAEMKSESAFEIRLEPDAEIDGNPIVNVYIGKNHVGYLRNNIGYRYLREIGTQTTCCNGHFEKAHELDDGHIADIGILLNCKTPFSVANSQSDSIKIIGQQTNVGRIFR